VSHARLVDCIGGSCSVGETSVELQRLRQLLLHVSLLRKGNPVPPAHILPQSLNPAYEIFRILG
jgi:hypothetical protein